MARLGTLVLKGLGILLLAVLIVSAVATVVGLAMAAVATVVSLVVTLVVLGVFVLALVGLWSLVREDSSSPAVETDTFDAPASTGERDPEERLRSRYLAGEIGDDEFERRLDRLLETEGAATELDGAETDRSRERESDRTRLWDR